MPAPSKNPNPITITYIFIDYDDTLLCSSWLASLGLLTTTTPLPTSVAQQLAEVELAVLHLLNRALLLTSRVCLLTNSDEGWIEISSRQFLPQLYFRLKEVEVLSARSIYEDIYPNKTVWWKYFAMMDKLSPWLMDRNVYKNVVSIGDSSCEREAAQSLCRSKERTRISTIKMVERPSVSELAHELQLVARSLGYVVEGVGNTDLILKVTPAKQQEQQQQQELTVAQDMGQAVPVQIHVCE
jgi:hypothetical protein